MTYFGLPRTKMCSEGEAEKAAEVDVVQPNIQNT